MTTEEAVTTNLPVSVLTKKQTKVYGPRFIAGWGNNAQIIAKLRFDDSCGNGHNTFAITGEIYIPGRRDIEAGGCLHEEIARMFPELQPLIKWHLVSTDGPMHYVSNTVYLAGERDCHGLLRGEMKQFKSKVTGTPLWKLNVSYEDYSGHVASEIEPAPRTIEYVPYGLEGEGKARELNAARSAAVWPDATDEDLCDASDLRERLMARLPSLMLEFKVAMEGLGFTY